jgi:hypothetical protein
VRRRGLETGESSPTQHFLVTDAEERFRRIAGQFLEQPVELLELVELRPY